MTTSIFERRKRQQVETEAAVKKLPQAESEFWSGLFTDDWKAENPPGFKKHEVFLIENPEASAQTKSGKPRPSHLLVAVPTRVDEQGQPVRLEPTDSHGFEIGCFWTRQGISEKTGKPYFFLSGALVDWEDAASMSQLLHGGLAFLDNRVQKRNARFSPITPEKEAALLRKLSVVSSEPAETFEERTQAALERAQVKIPHGYIWAVKLPSEKTPAPEQQELVPAGAEKDIPY